MLYLYTVVDISLLFFIYYQTLHQGSSQSSIEDHKCRHWFRCFIYTKRKSGRACSIRTRVNVYILNKKILWLGGCKRSKSSLDIIVNILFFNIYRVLVEQWIFHACLVVSVFIHVHESLICYGFKSYAIITTPLNIHKIVWRFEYHKHVQILKCSNLFGFLSIYKCKSSFFFPKMSLAFGILHRDVLFL